MYDLVIQKDTAGLYGGDVGAGVPMKYRIIELEVTVKFAILYHVV